MPKISLHANNKFHQFYELIKPDFDLFGEIYHNSHMHQAVKDGSPYSHDSYLKLLPIVELLKQSIVQISINDAVNLKESIKLAAFANHPTLVSHLINQGASQDDAVLGYALGGHTQKVEKLLERGALIDQAMFGYAMRGMTSHVEDLQSRKKSNSLPYYRQQKDDVLGYAMCGLQQEVDLLCSNADKPKEYVNSAIEGYARVNDEVSYQRMKAMYDCDAWFISKGLALGGHIEPSYIESLNDSDMKTFLFYLGAAGYVHEAFDIYQSYKTQENAQHILDGLAQGGYAHEAQQFAKLLVVKPKQTWYGKLDKFNLFKKNTERLTYNELSFIDHLAQAGCFKAVETALNNKSNEHSESELIDKTTASLTRNLISMQQLRFTLFHIKHPQLFEQTFIAAANALIWKTKDRVYPVNVKNIVPHYLHIVQFTHYPTTYKFNYLEACAWSNTNIQKLFLSQISKLGLSNDELFNIATFLTNYVESPEQIDHIFNKIHQKTKSETEMVNPATSILQNDFTNQPIYRALQKF